MVDVELLENHLTQLFSSELFIDVASPDVDLLEAGVMDSALILEILLLLEKHFGVQIPMEELELDSIRTIGSIAQLVATRRSAA